MAVFFAVPVFAAPSITGVNGTITSNQNIIISGTSFGTGPNIVIFDDFELGENGSYILSGNGSAQVGKWEAREGYPIYSNITSHSGNLSFRADTSLFSAQRIWTYMPTETTKWFYSFWAYMPPEDNWPGAGRDPGGINWKMLWATMNQYLYGGLATPVMLGLANEYDWVQFTYAGDSPTNFINYPNLNMSKGSWYRIWGFANLDTNGLLQCWSFGENGVHAALNVSRDTSSATYVNIIKLNGYARDTAEGECHPMFDDVYVAAGNNARARVEIGNQPIYNNCTNLTIITPTEWSDSSVTATVRQGSFNDGEQAYLFVVDENGDASEGYPVTFGGGSGDTTPPSSPSGLSAC